MITTGPWLCLRSARPRRRLDAGRGALPFDHRQIVWPRHRKRHARRPRDVLDRCDLCATMTRTLRCSVRVTVTYRSRSCLERLTSLGTRGRESRRVQCWIFPKKIWGKCGERRNPHFRLSRLPRGSVLTADVEVAIRAFRPRGGPAPEFECRRCQIKKRHLSLAFATIEAR